MASPYGSVPSPRSASRRNLIIGIVVGLVAVCACALGVVALAAGILFYQRGTVTPAEPTLGPDQTADRMGEIEAFVIVTRRRGRGLGGRRLHRLLQRRHG